MTKEATKHMFDAFGLGVGSPSIECICGRTHYAPDSECIEDGERAEMRAHELRSPKTVVMHPGDDGVSAKIVNGATVVPDCECGWFAKFEMLIWNERERILRYYKLRRDADAAAVAALDESLQANA